MRDYHIDTGADQLLDAAGAKQFCHRRVALRQITISMNLIELFLLRKIRWNRLLEFNAPHRVGIPRDKGLVSLFAFLEFLILLLARQFSRGARSKDFEHQLGGIKLGRMPSENDHHKPEGRPIGMC